MGLENHPTVQAYRQATDKRAERPEMFEMAWLKKEALEAGADDAGVM